MRTVEGLTTAAWREMARSAEAASQWFDAARCWEQAVAAYPSPVGQLAQRDIERMRERAVCCCRQAREG